MRIASFAFTAVVLLALFAIDTVAQVLGNVAYDIGSPTLTTLHVDPAVGNDSNSGTSAASPLRSVTEAWGRIPSVGTLSQGYRIVLHPGNYGESHLPNYWENRRGTQAAPVILEASGPGVVFLRDINAFNVHYFYLIGFRIAPSGGGDALHFERSSYLLMREMSLFGGPEREAHETLKINQSQHVYVENCDISGAEENALDYVAVQYGHIVRSRIHDAGDWCAYVKGGSAYITVEGNRFYDCYVGGFTAGQGTGFEYMTSPWLHYEAYDIKVVNNVIHDIYGAGLGVNGGYNILLAHNTLFRVGARSHALEVVFGLRACDGEVANCQTRQSAGGWGNDEQPASDDPIGNRNVFILNNLIYNPAGHRSAYQHFAIYGPRSARAGSNIPNPVRTDSNLQIRGNVIWDGPGVVTLGIEDSSEGCRDSNPTCHEGQLRSENVINGAEPQLMNPAGGDFRPAISSNLFGIGAVSLPAFSGGDRVSTPLAPVGILSNIVAIDRSGTDRGSSSIVGAYDTSDVSSEDPSAPENPESPEEPTIDAPPTIQSVRCSPSSVRRGGKVRCLVSASDDRGIRNVVVQIGRLPKKGLRRTRGRYEGILSSSRLAIGRHRISASVSDTGGHRVSRVSGSLRVRK